MRIKRIDICGFKSFCDRSTLDLRQAVTGVVGPNGCGKSNIVDALRWAMGELSARHLRGKQMEDVIFNGSDSRGPSGTAEVSITFENDGRVAPDYVGYEEITVSRRLNRDGTSEYLLNRLPVRLRDITNLFLGTGVGTKAYAIIEQGRVGLIVSAKPEDRRHYIEEAAGITKYRRRRQAAERKMEATRQNLLRVSDILDEIGSRLGSLRRQAKKAARYKAYRAEMRDIELWATSHSLLELIAEAKVVDTQLAELSRQRAEVQLHLDRAEAGLETARLEAAEEERRLDELQESRYQLDNRIKLTESGIAFRTHEAQQLETQTRAADEEAADLSRQAAASRSERAEVAQQLEALEGEQRGRAAELDVRQEVLVGLRRELLAVEEQLETERRAAAEAQRCAARAEASLRALGQRRRDIEERIERRRHEEGRVIDRLAALHAAASDMDGRLGSLRLTREQTEQRREVARSRIEELAEVAQRGEAELDVLRTELHRRRSRLTSLQEIQQRYEGFGRGTRAIMERSNGEARERGILGLVADVIETPRNYETALEAVLDQRLGAVIVENEVVGVEAIEFLKQNAEGRSSFIPRRAGHGPSILDRAPPGVVWEYRGERAVATVAADGASAVRSGSVEAPVPVPLSAQLAAPAARSGRAWTLEAEPAARWCGGASTPPRPGVHGQMIDLIRCAGDFRRVADNLLGDVVVVDSLEDGLALWDDLPGKTLVTLDGEILEPSGMLTGGSPDAQGSGVLRQKREIKELVEIIDTLEQDYQRTLSDHVSIKTELARMQLLLDETTRDGHQGEKEILTHEKDLARVTAEIESLAARQGELDLEFEQLQTTIDEVDRREAELGHDVAAADAQGRLADDVLYLLARERNRLAVLIEEAASGVTDAMVALAQVEAGCQGIAASLAQIDAMDVERQQRIERLTNSARQGTARAEELRREVEQQRDELAGLVAERAAVEDRIEHGRREYADQAAKVGEIEGSLKQLRTRVGELAEAVSAQQLRASEQRMRREHLEEQVWERYHERLSAVAGDFHLRPPVTEAQLDRLEQLRRLIERMGEINLTAIAEYEQLNERHEFLATHRADLEGALSQLQRAIQKINRTCRKRFVETFEAVNAKFQEVFPRLFAGGRARLVLVDGEGDVLKGGVDIVAQPPGKRLQSIEMMSGGEKALTAVSLIFAMFLVRPTPFCLLDEVDAPLDEANVVRFREMVCEMSESSQFIVITHNRRTMEIANTLYGVTMEEPGISKLVAVNLSQPN